MKSIKWIVAFGLFLIQAGCAGDDDTMTNVDLVDTDNTDLIFEEINWIQLNPDIFNYNIEGNKITLTLEQNGLWFHQDQGGLLYSEITGDFHLSADVKVRKRSNATEAPTCNICLGGLMVRSSGSEENYVHIVSGNIPENINDSMDEFGFEYKSTTNGVSEFEAITDGLSDHRLEICRNGSVIQFSVGSIGGSTEVVKEYERSDFGETLQVGFNIYTAQKGELADLQVLFEEIILENSCSD